MREGGVTEPLNVVKGDESNHLSALTGVCVEGWRFARIYNRVIAKLDAGDASRYVSQARYFLKKIDDALEAAGMRIVNLEGQLYDPGLPVSALNLGDFAPDDSLIIEQMVEPIVMGSGGLVRGGTVIVSKVNAQ
jgi:hypothetical protein